MRAGQVCLEFPTVDHLDIGSRQFSRVPVPSSPHPLIPSYPHLHSPRSAHVRRQGFLTRYSRKMLLIRSVLQLSFPSTLGFHIGNIPRMDPTLTPHFYGEVARSIYIARCKKA